MSHKTTRLATLCGAGAVVVVVSFLWSRTQNSQTPNTAQPPQSGPHGSPSWLMQGKFSGEASVPLRKREAAYKKPFSMRLRLFENNLNGFTVPFPPKARPERWLYLHVDKLLTPSGQELQTDWTVLPFVNKTLLYKKILWRPLSGGAWQTIYVRPPDKQQSQSANRENWYSTRMQQATPEMDKLKSKEHLARYSTGEWKLVVEGQAAWFDVDGALLCEARTTRERLVRVTPQTLRHRFDDEQRTHKTSDWSTKRMPVSDDERRNPLSHLEWQSEKRPGWKRLPLRTDPQNPVRVDEYDSIRLRAVRHHPARPWPDHIEQRVRWKTDAEPDEITVGDTFNARAPFHARVPVKFNVSATYGVISDVTFYIVPKVDSPPKKVEVTLDSSPMLRDEVLVGGQGSESVAHLTAESDVCSGATRLRIKSTYADGDKAGEVNGPGVADDEIYHNSSGCSDNDMSFTIRSGKRSGPVSVVAESLDTDGKVVTRSNTIKLAFVEPVVESFYPGTWEERNGVVQRSIRVRVITPRSRSLEGVPIALRVASLASYPINLKASWLSPASGVTGQHGEFVTTQFWKLVPGASLNLDNYIIKADFRTPSPTDQAQSKSPAQPRIQAQ